MLESFCQTMRIQQVCQVENDHTESMLAVCLLLQMSLKLHTAGLTRSNMQSTLGKQERHTILIPAKTSSLPAHPLKHLEAFIMLRNGSVG